MVCLEIPIALVVTSFVLLSRPLLIFIFFSIVTYSLIGFLVMSNCYNICVFHHPTSSKNHPVNRTGSGRTRSASATPSARLGALATFAVRTHPAVKSYQSRKRRSMRRNTTTIIWTTMSLGLTWTTNLLMTRWEIL